MYQKHCMVLLLLCFTLLTACAGQQRGMAGTNLVSSSRPAVDIAVPALPLREGGITVASVSTADSLGGVPVSTWLAVYGGTSATEPMAIAAISDVAVSYYWDSDVTRNFSVDHSIVTYNGSGFTACTYIIDGTNDAFAALYPFEDPSTLKFLARRFAQRSNFDESKITLEYREILPADITSVTDLSLYDRMFLEAFETRAYMAFVVQGYVPSESPLTNVFLKNVQVRFLNTNFLGTLSRNDNSFDE